MSGLVDRHLHLVGIGGAGMSALAVIAYAWGAEVSGCDRAESEPVRRLRRLGVDVAVGHDPAHLDGDPEVVVSSAIGEDEPELAEARRRGLIVRARAALLAEFVAARDSICVAGTHGKTTTTAMIAHAAVQLGLDPTYLIGGDVPQLGGNAWPGGGRLLVTEADESDRSCALLRPRVAVVTNLELDHHARFGSLDELQAVFAEWVTHLPEHGTLVVGEDVDLRAPAPVLRVGTGERADWRVSGIEHGWSAISFWLQPPAGDPLHVQLTVPGTHNALNAAAAVAALAAHGADPADVAAALSSFAGAGRRFEQRGEHAGATVVDDYAHHPTEVAAAIETARSQTAARVVACFQPHLYSRTQALADGFGRALALADEVVVCEIYPAREQPLEGVTAKLIVDAVSERRPGMRLAYEPSLAEAASYLRGRLRPGDLLLTIGAGDVRGVGDLLIAEP
jgi:UDP-N-acetylmuramate--alanine ligase